MTPYLCASRTAGLPMLLLLWLTPADAAAPIVKNPCLGSIGITTVAQLKNITSNLSGKYCLDNDLDLSSVRNFTPIGAPASSFSGQFNGQGHIIRNMKINSSNGLVGLFAIVSGSVFNLAVVNAKVTATGPSGDAGIVAGSVAGTGAVSTSHTTGSVSHTAGVFNIGGLAGIVQFQAQVQNSWSSAIVSGLDQSFVGGLVGENLGLINSSYATGAVSCEAHCAAGGLAGMLQPDSTGGHGTVTLSFATGPVTADSDSSVGGLVGHSEGRIVQAYASGPVFGGFNASVGSMGGWLDGVNVGTANAIHGVVSQTYGVGQNLSDIFTFSGGLDGSPGFAVVTNSYWDKNTTKQPASPDGTGKTTTQLQAALPAGFTSPWTIVKGKTYPYFSAGSPGFASILATVVNKKAFAFLPISQHEPSEYLHAPVHADFASLAAVDTMIARAIAVSDQVATLNDVKIDKYFWNDATEATTWIGPVTRHAILGTRLSIGRAALDESNVLRQLDLHNVVILRGTYTGADRGVTHAMLATSYIKNPDGSVSTVVADDPWTGQQVQINPTTKKIVVPPDFPLPDFTVVDYQSVTVK